MSTASGREEPCERPAETEAASEEGCAEDAEGKASGEKSQEEGRRQLRSLTPVGGGQAAVASRSRFRLEAWDWRFCAESSTFRRRMLFGVTSTHSSSRMNSSACSSDNG